MCETFAQSAEELEERLSKRQMLDMLARLIVQTNNVPNMDAVRERNSISEACSFQSSGHGSSSDNHSFKESSIPIKASHSSVYIKLESHSEKRVSGKLAVSNELSFARPSEFLANILSHKQALESVNFIKIDQ